MESSYQKFAKDVVIIGISNLLLSLSPLILLPLLTKTLGASAYGIWSQVDVTTLLVVSVVVLGLPFALSRFLAAETDKEKLQEGFYSTFIIVTLATVAASILIVILAEPIAEAFFEGAIEVVRITGLIIFVWSLDTMFLSFFRARRQMVSYGIFMVVSRCVEIGIIAYLVFNGSGLVGAVLCLLGVRALLLLALFFLIKRQIGIKKPSFGNIKEYLDFSLPTIPGNIAAWVSSYSDRYIIGYFLGVASVGVYSAGYNLVSIILMLISVFGFVLPPTLSKLYDEGKIDELKILLTYSLKYFLAVAIPFVFGVSILSEPILRIFSTPEMASQNYVVVPLLALSLLLVGVASIICNTLILTMKTKVISAIWIISALVNLGLNIILVPRLGIEGAALGSLITFSLVCGIGSYYSFKEIKFAIDWGFIVKSLIASILMAIVVWLMRPQNALFTAITVLVGVAGYGLAIFLLRGFAREEISFFRRLLVRNTSPVNSDDTAG